MTRIVGDPEAFVDDALEGFARAHRQIVRRVEGGIVRARPLASGKVAVIVGGGSGHYPAFAGLVGIGVAAGAVCGNIFSSPSTRQAVGVGRAIEAGGGILFSFGNYAGDVIHFGAAERELRESGIDVRTVLVTDDIASGPADAIDSRRGIAGDLCVFRIAGAAAEEGADLDEVERIARHANNRTRTLGVAFAGCTLPGAGAPLFTVPEGMMSVGLGIHGEPGVRDVPLEAAPELARTLLEPLLAERPEGADDRVVLIVNGLGTVKYEELFVLYRHLTDLLEARGIAVVSPLCGELVTSLDMGGVSVTLLWIDDELERLWNAPAAAPAFTRGGIAREEEPGEPADEKAAEPAPLPSPRGNASPASREAAALATQLFREVRDAVAARADDLGDLDAIAGDGDHGVGMVRGIDAAVAATADTDASLGVGEQLRRAGSAWADRAGGTSGALWGAALEAMGDALSASEPSAPAIAEAIHAGRTRMAELGGAALGDKTLLDALIPYDEEFRRRVEFGAGIREAMRDAAAVATAAADATAELTPRKGRARPLAERSIGHADPGAVSFALIVQTVAAHDPAAHDPAAHGTKVQAEEKR
ncbi:dihydroxyacetone kinase family protein [uncultured Microbacterium sp.]|uniref:dihydroxyacetone kinase family protein n=1 Tax=uncultured Microbacterium sp. TaxID=191216 RepID=UPI0028D1BE24|nr:dihydroxyacetone kinase family protein [uncultured Microbacterium sp.]